MRINIKPVDVLFFRDSRPFARGSEHFTKSLFPPSPQTLYGALRTKVLEDLGCDYEEYRNGHLVLNKPNEIERVKEEVGLPDKTGTFRLKGPLLLNKDDAIYLKIPADVKEIKEDNEYQVLEPFNWGDFKVETDFTSMTNYPHLRTSTPLEDVEGYISLQTFNNYALEGKVNEVISPQEIYSYEIRTGIGTEPASNTTKEGQLYTVGFVRMKDEWSFYAEIENLSSLPSSGLIKFGGGNRVCEYATLDDNPLNHYATNKIKKSIAESRRFKIVFLTPAEFNNGWISDRFDQNLELQLEGLKIKLVSACLQRAEVISGWDLAKNRAKPLRKLVPAGSVYYFELLKGDVNELFERLNLVNFSDKNSNLGFGLTLIGRW